MTPVLADLPQHIASRIGIDPVTGEWIWTGPLDKDGYGRIDGRGAHRVIYELLIKPIPDKLVIDHVKARGCTRPACVSWWHLEPVTARVNTLRGTSFAAVNFRKQACGACGEPYDLLNTYHYKGRRDCRVCIRRRVREYKARLRAGQSSTRQTMTRAA